jgi:putative aminopeptidase FrvX
MARSKKGAFGQTYRDRRRAELALGLLQNHGIKVDLREVQDRICGKGGSATRKSWMLFAHRDEVRLAVRILKEAGFSE